MLLCFLLSCIVLGEVICVSPEFDDQLHYSISWNGVLPKEAEKSQTQEKVLITTNQNEQYQCYFPDAVGFEDKIRDVSDGPSPEVLLADLFLGDLHRCSYRLEPYWTYELCHGQKLKQFHEEKDGDGTVQKSEFILGTLTKAETREILNAAKTASAPGKLREAPTRIIDNKDTPYYSIEMGNGTPCDLSNGIPRKTTVLYICHPGANNEVVSVKETVTCEYEAIVLTPFLCGNPAYVVKDKEIHDIQCHAISGSPNKPSQLAEYSPHRHRPPQQQQRQQQPQQKPPPAADQKKRTHYKHTDKTINAQFLKGEYCLHGGSGWWKYEFCNGKHIVQYHVEPNGKKTVIVVGIWREEIHLKHIKENNIKPKHKNSVSHFYSNGDVCDLTAKPRFAQIKLICKEGSGQPLSIYMTEESPCVYTVGVESPILCSFVKNADHNGLFAAPEK